MGSAFPSLAWIIHETWSPPLDTARPWLGVGVRFAGRDGTDLLEDTDVFLFQKAEAVDIE
jgi:hypothetical protein